MTLSHDYLVNLFLDNPTHGQALRLRSLKNNTAEFSVNGVPGIIILDNRPAVISHMEDSKIFCHTPATLTFEKDGDRVTYHLSSAPAGIKKSDVVFKLWIASGYKGNTGTHKFITFNGATDDRDLISFVTLFRYR